MTTKHPIDSKTLWINLILAILAIYKPGFEEFCRNNPSALPILFALANFLLRFVSREAVSFKVPIHFFGIGNRIRAERDE